MPSGMNGLVKQLTFKVASSFKLISVTAHNLQRLFTFVLILLIYSSVKICQIRGVCLRSRFRIVPNFNGFPVVALLSFFVSGFL